MLRPTISFAAWPISFSFRVCSGKRRVGEAAALVGQQHQADVDVRARTPIGSPFSMHAS